jgi:NAD(P)-dependent dehydrogenase (short-subunit alcohol dehydrogenase family)
MDLHLANKTAVVTGASRGIGLAVARALADESVRVVGAARTITPELKEATVAAISADLATKEGAATLVDTAMRELGGVDILINNVGAGDADRLGLGGFLDVDDRQWRDLFDLNLSAPSGRPVRRCRACSNGGA